MKFNRGDIKQPMFHAQKSFCPAHVGGEVERVKQDIARMLAAAIVEKPDLFTVKSEEINGMTLTTVELCFTPMTEQDIKLVYSVGVHDGMHHGMYRTGASIDFLPVSLLGEGKQ